MIEPRTVLAFSAGATIAYFLDPQLGRTRRTKTKDQVAGAVRRRRRRIETQVEQKTDYLQDRAHGLKQEVARSPETQTPDNDRTLVDKVRSEVLGQEEFRPYTINVDAADGVVVLRGQMDRPEQIRALRDAVSRVPGVRLVENYLHLPGIPPPNEPGIPTAKGVHQR